MKENYSFWRVLFFLVRRRVSLLVLLALDTFIKYQIPRVVITFFSAKTQEFMAVPTKIEPCLPGGLGPRAPGPRAFSRAHFAHFIRKPLFYFSKSKSNILISLFTSLRGYL